MLDEIRSGTYAKNWIAENDAGRPWFNSAVKRSGTIRSSRSACG